MNLRKVSNCGRWSIDGVVLRVFKINEDKGISFPKTRAMTVYSSFWNADDWACQGGQVKNKLDPRAIHCLVPQL
jgi:hypothetical protein